jgi:hypothetical protein
MSKALELVALVQERATWTGKDATGNKVSLPSLEGSEKQIAWAQEIRARMLNEAWAYYFVKFASGFSFDKSAEFDTEQRTASEARATAFRNGIVKMASQKEARFFIDHKSETGITVVCKISKASAEANETQSDAPRFPRIEGTREKDILVGSPSWSDFVRQNIK